MTSATKLHHPKAFEEDGTWSMLEKRCSSILGAKDFGELPVVALPQTSATRRLDQADAVKNEFVLQMVNTLKKTHGTVDLLRKERGAAESGRFSMLRYCIWVAFTIFTLFVFTLPCGFHQNILSKDLFENFDVSGDGSNEEGVPTQEEMTRA